MESNLMCKCYIFGAHSRAQTLAVYLHELSPETQQIAFLVDNDEDNPRVINDIPVLHLPQDDLDTEAAVYIGTRGVYHSAIMERLRTVGFENIIPVTPQLDTELRNQAIPVLFKKAHRQFVKLEKNSEDNETNNICRIYIVHSSRDVLNESHPVREYESYIQAGTDLDDKCMEECSLFDNLGDNISSMNRRFCELTALYWLWKNCDDEVIGLEHYRRRFILPDDWQKVFAGDSNDSYDVILPTPLFVYPNLEENYLYRHDNGPYHAMMTAVKRLYPDEAYRVKGFFEENGLYSPCNMLITRREVLHGLCEWLFPILFAVADEIGEIDDAYQNRYPGFLSERLISYYFYSHEGSIRVAYADKSFIE